MGRESPRYPRGPRSQPQSRPWSLHLRFFQTKPGRTDAGQERGQELFSKAALGSGSEREGSWRDPPSPPLPSALPAPPCGHQALAGGWPQNPRLFVQLSSHPQATGSCLYALACRAWSGVWTPAASQPRTNAGGRRAARPSHVSLWVWPLLFWTWRPVTSTTCSWAAHASKNLALKLDRIRQ